MELDFITDLSPLELRFEKLHRLFLEALEAGAAVPWGLNWSFDIFLVLDGSRGSFCGGASVTYTST